MMETSCPRSERAGVDVLEIGDNDRIAHGLVGVGQIDVGRIEQP